VLFCNILYNGIKPSKGEIKNMRYIKFLVVPLLFVTLAFMNIGGCGSNSGGGKDKEGCCVVDGGDLGVICFEDLDKEECDFLDGNLKKGKMCENVQECVEPPPGEGCCVFGDNDCQDGLGQEGCDDDGGVFNAEVMCVDVAQCNLPLGEGCCVFGDNDCQDGLGIIGCADLGGVFNAEVMCVNVAQCNLLPVIHDVSMESPFVFVPADITIKVGDTVRWTNNDVINHTTQDDNDTIWNSNSQFMLPDGMVPGDVFEFTFNAEGLIAYFCLFHGGAGGVDMSGTITVEP